ncbi:MAG: ABC transporter ATP-binding protein [Candidatus Nanopelagicales bacterium]
MSMQNAWAAYRAVTQDKSELKPVSRSVVRRIVGYAKPYRRIVIAFLITLIFISLLTVAQPLLFRVIVDDGITVGNGVLVTWLAIAIAGLAIIDALIGVLSRWYSSRIGEGLIFDLRTQVFGHVQRQSIAFFTRAQTGALVSRLNSDVLGAQQAFTSTLGGVVGNLITTVIVLVTMLILSWQVTVLALLLVPLFLLPARWMGRRLQKLTRQQMQDNARMNAQMTERFNVAGALLVTLFGRPAAEDAEFGERAARVRDAGVSIAMANRWFFTALALVASLATAIAYGVGGNLVISETITLGTLLAIIALLAQLYGPLTALSNVRVDVMTALVSFDRVFEVLDLPPLVKDSPSATPLPDGPLSIQFNEVSFAYPTAAEVSLASLESIARQVEERNAGNVLTDVSFRVEPGQLVALVGPSGAGKSTMIGLVARLYDVSAGQVLIGGENVRDATLSSLHEAIGMVTQEAHMFHDTIRQNLLYAKPDATQEQMMAALSGAHILKLIASLPEGLDTVVGDRGHRLSGGEKQRIALARLLLRSPRIVLLDEATAHLDSESEAAVQAALDTALAGRTSLVIAHRLSTVRKADQILVVEAGGIVERGTHDELVAADGVYASLYRTQFAEN